jgi:hypothetical protein
LLKFDKKLDKTLKKNAKNYLILSKLGKKWIFKQKIVGWSKIDHFSP